MRAVQQPCYQPVQQVPPECAALPVAAQQTLEDFVQQGGGFIAGQWNGYELMQGQQVDMPDLVLQRWFDPDADNAAGRTRIAATNKIGTIPRA